MKKAAQQARKAAIALEQLPTHYENTTVTLRRGALPDGTKETQEHTLNIYDKIASGAQGIVFTGTWDDAPCVCKAAPTVDGYNAVIAEWTMLRAFREFIPVPQPIARLQEQTRVVVVEERLDRTLNELRPYFQGKEGECIKLCADITRILEHMHSRGFIYIDIKPHNFMSGFDDRSHIIHVVDLGGVGKAGEIAPQAGTALYTSIASQRGQPLTYESDLESLGYMIADLYYGRLPWSVLIEEGQRLPMHQINRFLQEVPTRMAEMKATIPLFSRETLPEMVDFMQIVKVGGPNLHQQLLAVLDTVEGDYPWPVAEEPPVPTPRPLRPLQLGNHILDIAPDEEPQLPVGMAKDIETFVTQKRK